MGVCRRCSREGQGVKPPNDTLLEWLSERGEGSWTQLREAYDWLFPITRRERWQTAGFAARMLSALGHLEIDWATQHWSAAPTTLTLLPNAGGHALLTGARTRTLIDDLETEIGDSPELFPLPVHPQQLAPSAKLIACNSARAARRLADALDIRFSHSASEQLSSMLPPLDARLRLGRSAKAPVGYGVQALDLTDLRWRDVESFERPGFYRHAAPAGPTFRLVDNDGLTYAVDLARGIYAALSRWGESRLKYMPQSVNGELVVPVAAPLPTLQARTAALCTGLAPEKRAQTFIYPNVPEHIAAAIAKSLDQSLQYLT